MVAMILSIHIKPSIHSYENTKYKIQNIIILFMNILLINHYAGSPKHGMEYRPYYLAREWVRNGHEVTILAASHSHIRTHQPILNGASVHLEIIDGINYYWCKTPKYSGNGISRVYNISVFLKQLKNNRDSIVKTIKPDVVIASSTYPMDIWSAHYIAREAGAQLIYEVHDLWPLSPIELGGISRFHPFIIWCQKAEDYAYKHSNKIISMLPKTLSHMESRGMAPEKFNYIPNGISIEDWENNEPLPNDINTELTRIKELGKPIIGYAGTHGLANALDTLLDAAKLSEDEFEVVLVGLGPSRKSLLQRVKDENISNVTMLPAIPKTCIPSFLNIIDIAYIGWHRNPLYRFGISPNKLMDYMMAAKPIVHSIEAGNDPVSEAECGITVKPLDALAVRNAIAALSKLPLETLEKMGANGRKFICANQTYPALAQKFISILEK